MEKMEKSFAEKLIKVISIIPTMPKNSKGYGYNYTNLDDIFKTIKPILAENGLGFIQKVTMKENITGVETILFDSEGNSESSFTPLPETTVKGANSAQNMGASITYIKRYSISAMLGISSDEDTDGTTPKTTQGKQNYHKQVQGESNAIYLENLITEYQAELGQNYNTALQTLQTGSDSEIVTMIDRCKTFLYKKGIRL